MRCLRQTPSWLVRVWRQARATAITSRCPMQRDTSATSTWRFANSQAFYSTDALSVELIYAHHLGLAGRLNASNVLLDLMLNYSYKMQNMKC